MELKTKIIAEDSKQELLITREFDLPVELLFKAHAEREFVAQWMGTNVLELEAKKHGNYRFETSDAQGNVVFRANGVIHEFMLNQKIIRTFEMDNTPFGVQLEIYEFQQLSNSTSKLNIHIIYESVAQRDQLLKMPFAQGLNYAHNRLEQAMNQIYS